MHATWYVPALHVTLNKEKSFAHCQQVMKAIVPYDRPYLRFLL